LVRFGTWFYVWYVLVCNCTFGMLWYVLYVIARFGTSGYRVGFFDMMKLSLLFTTVKRGTDTVHNCERTCNDNDVLCAAAPYHTGSAPNPYSYEHVKARARSKSAVNYSTVRSSRRPPPSSSLLGRLQPSRSCCIAVATWSAWPAAGQLT
jgi:hypothetical protein